MWYLFGIVKSNEKTNFGPIGFADAYGEKGKVRTIPFKEMAIVASEMDEWKVDETNKTDLLQKLLVHQKTLEQVMKQQFVIPIKFGTVVESRQDIVIIQENGYPLFEKTFREMKGKIEAALTVSWDVPTCLKSIAEEDAEVQELKKQAQAAGDQGALLKIGIVLGEKLKEKRKSVASQIYQSLNAFGESRVDHEQMEDKMVLNSSFLLPQEKEKDFMKQIHRLDEEFSSKLMFKCLSPLPPHSFRTALIQKIMPKQLQEAMFLFDVQENTTLEGLKEKNRELVHRYHPDAKKNNGEGDSVPFSKVHQAYDFLKSFYELEKNPFAKIDKDHCFVTKMVEGGLS